MVMREKKRTKTVKKYAAKRKELKAIVLSPKASYEDKMAAQTKLQKLPRDASPTRLVNRCEVSGRRRGFIRRFKVSRLTFRELASQGLIPGVTKSSW
jgi:small subunit ribosomal protein S14